MDPNVAENKDPLLLVVESGSKRAPQDRISISAPAHSARLNGFADRHPNGLSVRRFLQTLIIRWQLIAIVAACVIAATVAAVVFLPSHYRSEAKLLVRLGRESVVIDPTARIGQSAVPMEGRDKEINSEIELLKSRKLVESIVDCVGANRILSLAPGKPESPDNVSKAITLVEDKLAVEAVPESNILSIHFEARDPEVARDVIAKLIDAYLDERANIYREPGDLKFFQDQLATARDEQSDIQRQIQALRDTSGVADTTQQRLSLLKHIDDIQQEIDKDRADQLAQAAAVKTMIEQTGSADAEQQRQIQIAKDSLLSSMIQSLQTQKTEALADLKRVNQVEVEMQKLQQAATLTAARVTQYAEAYEQSRIDREMGQQRLSNISIAEPPVLPLTPKAPSRGLLAIAGLFMAMTLGLGSAFVAEAVDHTVRRAEDLADLGVPQTVSIPVLSRAELKPRFKRLRLPKIYQGNGRARENIIDVNEVGSELAVQRETGTSNGHSTLPAITVVGVAIRPAGPLSTSARMLDSIQGVVERLIPPGASAASGLIGVVGARPRQGTSLTAFHLAVSLSQRLNALLQDPDSTERVLLLDADIESCRASELAGLPVVPRIREDELPDLYAQFPLASMTSPEGTHRLDVLTTGLRQMNRSVLLAQMPQLLRGLRPRYRHIVIDLPCLSQNESSARFAALCSAVVLVTKADELRVETARHALNRLREAHANVTVAVLNQRSYSLPEWIYRRS